MCNECIVDNNYANSIARELDLEMCNLSSTCMCVHMGVAPLRESCIGNNLLFALIITLDSKICEL